MIELLAPATLRRLFSILLFLLFLFGSSGSLQLVQARPSGPVVISFADPQPSYLEGNGGWITPTKFQLTILRVGDLSVPHQVYAQTSGGTAVSGVDFVPFGGIVYFPESTSARIIEIEVNGDSLDEYSETFTVTLTTQDPDVTIVNGVAQVEILDDDEPPTLDFAPISLDEGDLGTTAGVFDFSLDSASGKTITVTYETIAGSALSGVDFVPASGALVFLPGETGKTAEVQALGDYLDESDEQASLQLSKVTTQDVWFPGGNPDSLSRSFTILDDDTAGFSLWPAEPLVTREDGASAQFSLKLNSQPTADVTVLVSNTNPDEGLVQPTTLTFTPVNWAQEQWVTVSGVDDNLYDEDIQYEILLNDVSSADPGYDGRDAGTVTVINLNDDGPIYMPFSLARYQTPYYFHEMFNSEDAADDWGLFVDPSAYSVFVSNGEYHLRQRTALYNIKSIPPIQALDGMTYSVEVEARLIPGSNLSTRYGLIFDWNGQDQFYRLLVVPGTQSFLVQRWQDTWVTLTNGSGTSPVINGGTQVNKIKLIRSGASIRVFVNGVELNPGLISDSTYSGGLTGVIMVASDTANLYADEVAFDEFVVQQIYE